jgi:hypothetical protein
LALKVLAMLILLRIWCAARAGTPYSALECEIASEPWFHTMACFSEQSWVTIKILIDFAWGLYNPLYIVV